MKIIKGESPQGEHPAVHVHCYPSPKDRSIVISYVTASHVVGDALNIVKVVERSPMTKDEAIKNASAYAYQFGLTQIYVKDDFEDSK